MVVTRNGGWGNEREVYGYLFVTSRQISPGDQVHTVQ